MKAKTLFFVMLALLASCSGSNDEPLTRTEKRLAEFCVDGKPVLGIWQIVDISNEYNGAVKWDNWQDTWGEIFLSFNADGTCTTSYKGANAMIEERKQQGLPDFPYVYNHYKIEGNTIYCFDQQYKTFSTSVFEVKSIKDNEMEVLLQGGMYCMLSSASQPQLRMVWKKVDTLP